MTNTKKLLLGAATIWPFAYIIGFMAFVFSMIGGGPSGSIDPALFMIMPLHLVTIFSIFGLIIYYITHLLKNEALDTTRKVIWAICLVKLNMFAMPIYWYLHVWSKRRQVAPLANPALLVDEDVEEARRFLDDADAQSRHDLEEFERKLAEVPQTVSQR